MKLPKTFAPDKAMKDKIEYLINDIYINEKKGDIRVKLKYEDGIYHVRYSLDDSFFLSMECDAVGEGAYGMATLMRKLSDYHGLSGTIHTTRTNNKVNSFMEARQLVDKEELIKEIKDLAFSQSFKVVSQS